ncbi:phosphoinositide phosphatase SAC8 isoform X5 [Magnolia sinica]|uniref:phosphoinositide phosphatase SAC8 isoform X5 n=1 Tax=Magnolia sinica TaxID=86752 RepID=UPI0026592CDB|nr:phosphoinositide phosphatase SAC8 isoform X5 [Magnolia sinica]
MSSSMEEGNQSSSSHLFNLHRKMELQEFPDKFVIRSVDSESQRLQALSIDRSDGIITPYQFGNSCFGTPNKVSTIFGVVGTIRLLAGTYVLVITSQKEVGAYLGFPVFRVMSMKFLSCNEALKLSTPQEKRDEAYFLSLLRTVESTPGLYYSYEVDLTLNLQRTCKLAEGRMSKPLWKQIRGSIPILWEQIVDLSYKPQLKIINHEETPKVVERHFHDLTQRYGEIMAVDLTDKHGDEGQLSSAYAAEMQNLPHVRYVSFDFHHCCRNANFDNLNLLYDQISDDIKKQGYFLINSEREILLEQKGVVRVNCIDCLDRTNVTQVHMDYCILDLRVKHVTLLSQSDLGRKSLNTQLQRMEAFSPSESISSHPDIDEKFKILWVEQGDEISLEYSGTHALKGDLVRYGRQTVSGLIKDGMSALSRYYLNNFHDGIRQDAMDLISGRYTANRNSPSPFQLNGFESFSYLPVASTLIIGGLTLTTFTFNQAGRHAHHFVSSVFWAGLTAGVMALVKANGRQFCSRPRLCSLL